jgi:GAF domain-containing protein
LSWRASLVVTGLSVLAGLALAYAEQSGLIRGAFYPVTSFARDIAFLFALNMALIYLLIHGMEGALKKSRVNLLQLEDANTDLSTAQNALQARSNELLKANEQLESRTKKLQAIAAVARTVASVHNFDLLLSSITSIVSRQLGYHHVALFLLDEQREYAILRSSNIDIYQKLVDRRYQLPARSRGSVSLVIQTNQPQLVSAAEQSIFLNQAGIPLPGSEIVLPLRAQDQVIGVLVLQSLESNAFSKDDISILALLSDQIAITIQNSLLYEQSENALRQADLSSMQRTVQAWKRHGKEIETKGYRYDGIKSEPLREARATGDGNGPLLVPVQLRGQTIGSFKLNALDASRSWTDDELFMVRATAERVALALESARLLQEAEKRAAREAFLADVSSKLSSSFQMDSILRDTVQELGETLKHSTVTFQLVNPAMKGTIVENKPESGEGDE